MLVLRMIEPDLVMYLYCFHVNKPKIKMNTTLESLHIVKFVAIYAIICYLNKRGALA